MLTWRPQATGVRYSLAGIKDPSIFRVKKREETLVIGADLLGATTQARARHAGPVL